MSINKTGVGLEGKRARRRLQQHMLNGDSRRRKLDAYPK